MLPTYDKEILKLFKMFQLISRKIIVRKHIISTNKPHTQHIPKLPFILTKKNLIFNSNYYKIIFNLNTRLKPFI